MSARQPTVPTYDGQADTYDERVGPPEEACAEIARSVRSIGDVRPGDLIVDAGAGTGRIGAHLASPPTRYIGFDLSTEMLEVFRQRQGPDAGDAVLVQADGNENWPIRDGAVRLVFSSRAVHLMGAERVVREVFRLASPKGATFLIGRVQRRPESVKARMRDEMRRRLSQRGLAGRETRANRTLILEAFSAGGASRIEAGTLSQWEVTTSPRHSLESWQRKEGLAGMTTPAAMKREVLDDLAAWAVTEFGGLDVAMESVEAYVVEGVRIPATSGSEADQ